MKLLPLMLVLGSLFILPQEAFCGILEKVAGQQIAVEKLTGRGEEYDINFSGWVGSLTIAPQNGLVLISEFSDIDGRIAVINGMYKITKIEEYEKSVDLECVDANPLTSGIKWRGKLWLTDSNEIKVEIVQKQSSRKWVNLSDYGKKFLKENGIEKLNLGI